MIQNHPKYQLLQLHTKTEIYRTDTSTLLAYDESKNKYLFRALNSVCFIQNDNNESIEILKMDKAEELWHQLPIKNISNIYEAFPKFLGGTRKSSCSNDCTQEGSCSNHCTHKKII